MKKIRRIFGGKSKSDEFLHSPTQETNRNLNDSTVTSLHSSKSSQSSKFHSTTVRLPKLHQAAKTGNLMKIDKELRKRSIDSVDSIGRTPIHIACLYNKVEAVRMLCRQPKVNVNTTDNEGRTALMCSAEYGNYECCEILLNHKADISMCDNYGCNSLHYAMCTEEQNSFIIRLLCQAGVPVHQKNINGQTPLHFAAKHDQKTFIPILLKYNCELDTTDCEGRTAAMISAAEGHYDSVDILIRNGADSGIKDVRGNTVESVAQINGHVGIFERLMELKYHKSTSINSKQEENDVQSSESESEFTKVSQQVPIPRAAAPTRGSGESASKYDCMSWKSSSSESEQTSKISNESLKPNEVDFAKIMNTFDASNNLQRISSDLKDSNVVVNSPYMDVENTTLNRNNEYMLANDYKIQGQQETIKLDVHPGNVHSENINGKAKADFSIAFSDDESESQSFSTHHVNQKRQTNNEHKIDFSKIIQTNKIHENSFDNDSDDASLSDNELKHTQINHKRENDFSSVTHVKQDENSFGDDSEPWSLGEQTKQESEPSQGPSMDSNQIINSKQINAGKDIDNINYFDDGSDCPTPRGNKDTEENKKTPETNIVNNSDINHKIKVSSIPLKHDELSDFDDTETESEDTPMEPKHIQALESSIEDQNNVNHMIEDINDSIQLNIETIEGQIYERDDFIKNLQTENQELKQRVVILNDQYLLSVNERTSLEEKVKHQYETGDIESQFEEYENQINLLEKYKIEKDIEITSLTTRFQSDLSAQIYKNAEFGALQNSTSESLERLRNEHASCEAELQQFKIDNKQLHIELDNIHKNNSNLVEVLKIQKLGSPAELMCVVYDDNSNGTKFVKDHVTPERTKLLTAEIERLKIETGILKASTSDGMVKLHTELEDVSLTLKQEIDDRKMAQKEVKKLRLKINKLRLNEAKRKKMYNKELQEIRSRYYLEARKELEEKLAQVSQFLAQQNEQNNSFEKIRKDNLEYEKHVSHKRIADLEEELVTMKTKPCNISDSRYEKLYHTEIRARELSNVNLKRIEQKFKELQQKFEQEKVLRSSNVIRISERNITHRKSVKSDKYLDASFSLPNPQTRSHGIYRRMQDYVDRAALESISTSNTLQRI